MELKIAQISSLEKIRVNDPFPQKEIHTKSVLAGQRFSYQICIQSSIPMHADITLESPLKDHIRLYCVKDAYMDMPATAPDLEKEDYITLEPGYMPDILIPLSAQHDQVLLTRRYTTFWVKADIPADAAPGTYPISLTVTSKPQYTASSMSSLCTTLQLNVLPAVMPEQKLIYTRWFYADCIAVQHNVEIFSEAHWDLIDKYIAAAADVGINMILVPTHTPPLDTAVGTARPCVQLVNIEKNGDVYTFSFSRFKRFIDLCKKNGIRYYEMAHMFSQWGAKSAPNIMVTENGKTDYLFGWHVSASSPEYINFLKQYISALYLELEKEGISENTYFHISDEPTLDNLDTYKKASEIIRPLLGNSKTFDALSHYEIYEKGLIECPVTSVTHIHEFLEHEIPNQWAYYCCYPQTVFPNSFLAMPSSRARILGFLLYKYNIKGFLHWGFNYYNAQVSYYPINPYLTTSADGAFPSGDPFIVYPGRGQVYPSIRGEMIYEAIQDMNLCFALEAVKGREAVVQMIDQAAGRDLRFDDYPKGNTFLEDLRDAMVDKLK